MSFTTDVHPNSAQTPVYKLYKDQSVVQAYLAETPPPRRDIRTFSRVENYRMTTLRPDLDVSEHGSCEKVGLNLPNPGDHWTFCQKVVLPEAIQNLDLLFCVLLRKLGLG